MFDTIIHRWLRVPYALHIRDANIVKRAQMTYVFVHGLGDTGELWSNVLKKLPKNVNYIAVDLLGFGESPRPTWSEYDAHAQARSLLATYRKLLIRGPVTFVGHSLGALVCVEVARRYPKVSQLVLCSPPIYGAETAATTKKLLSKDAMLRRVYTLAVQDPKRVVEAYAIGQKLKLIGPTISVSDDTIHAFLASFHASILNQRTTDSIEKLQCPVAIINGRLDPFTVMKNLKELAAQHEHVSLTQLPVGHGLNALYITAILRALGVVTVTPTRNKK